MQGRRQYCDAGFGWRNGGAGQPRASEAAAVGASGHAGRGKYEVSLWLNPLPGLNKPF